MILVPRLRDEGESFSLSFSPQSKGAIPGTPASHLNYSSRCNSLRVVVKAFCGTRNGRLESRRIPMRGSLGAEFCVPIPFYASKLPEYRQQHYAMLGSLMIALPVLFLSLIARRNNNLHPTTVLFLAKPHCFSILIFS